MNIIKKLVTICSIFALPLLSLSSIHAASYDVIFRAGAHGTFSNGERKLVVTIDSQGFPDEPDVQVEDGYSFLGWSKTLPKSGSQVTEQMEFIAKYKVLTNGREYHVEYVDTYGTALASDKVLQADLGDEIVMRAKTIDGYTPDVFEKTIKVNESNNNIRFVYKNGKENPLIKEVVNEVPGTTPNTSNTNPGGNQDTNQPNNPEVEIKDPEQPQGDGEEIEENEQPQGEGMNSIGVSVSVIAGICLLAGLSFLVILKKRKKEETEASN